MVSFWVPYSLLFESLHNVSLYTNNREHIFIITICLPSVSFAKRKTLLHLTISARPVSLAEAVPEREEDQPCISCSPIYMSIPGLYAVQDGGTTN